MSVTRDPETGRFTSDHPDPMTRAMIEARANTRGMRILHQMIDIDRKLREEAKNE